ncbi:hypothetical protein GYMLUDRAFT_241347 [Collybiopsis luxurians FD-317 M1]|uniref:Cyanovirin-N domain-containing protein n=1 Tax=Collybiopsis luxurians FD-317 M1 TaxID=944289 RepID=A0A0D0C7I6_9AGAR|nr:hypothetical protein GYMLUDRAFT_241347 [Collybiopsis luxurians FD-317 M1]
MPFDRSYQKPRLVNNSLTVKYGGKSLAMDLSSCLGIANDKLVWRGRGGFSAMRNVEYQGRWVKVNLDLSTNIQVKDNRLRFISAPPRVPSAAGRDRPAVSSSAAIGNSHISNTSPTSYEESTHSQPGDKK